MEIIKLNKSEIMENINNEFTSMLLSINNWMKEMRKLPPETREKILDMYVKSAKLSFENAQDQLAPIIQDFLTKHATKILEFTKNLEESVKHALKNKRR